MIFTNKGKTSTKFMNERYLSKSEVNLIVNAIYTAFSLPRVIGHSWLKVSYRNFPECRPFVICPTDRNSLESLAYLLGSKLKNHCNERNRMKLN